MSSREIQVLSSLLGRLKASEGGAASPKKKTKAKRKTPQPASTPGTTARAAGPGSSGRRRGQMSAFGSSAMGTARLRRQEFLCEVKGTASAGFAKAIQLIPSGEVMPWLNTICQGFEKIVWHRATISYRPAVGTTKDGLIKFGVDWSSPANASAATSAYITACTPFLSGPVWQAMTMALPAAQLQSRRQYVITSSDKVDASPGSLLAMSTVASTDVVGEFWITYDVTLSGTRKA